jgi:hypothetical protein
MVHSIGSRIGRALTFCLGGVAFDFKITASSQLGVCNTATIGLWTTEAIKFM